MQQSAFPLSSSNSEVACLFVNCHQLIPRCILSRLETLYACLRRLLFHVVCCFQFAESFSPQAHTIFAPEHPKIFLVEYCHFPTTSYISTNLIRDVFFIR